MGIISNQAKPRGTLQTLWEGLKLAYNNLALLHPILLLSFLSTSLFYLISNLCLTPLVLDLTAKSSLIGNTDPESPEFSLQLTAVLKDLKEVALIAVLLLIISFLVKSLVAAAAVHVLSTAYSTSKTPSSKLEEVFSTLSRSLIKRCMITQLYAAFVYLACILMVGLTAGVLSFSFTYSYSSSSRSYVALMVIFAIVVAVLELYLYFYLSMVVNTSVVVSVVEEGRCYGVEAIAKASKLVGGRRKQAIRIALVELAVGGVLYGVHKLGMARAPPVSTARWALGFGKMAVGVVVNVLTWSVLTVYYYECSAGHTEEGIAVEGGFQYSPVPTLSQ